MIRHSRKEVKRQRQVPPDGSPSAQVPALHRERVPGVPGGHVAERGPADLVPAVRQRHLRVLDRLDAVGLGEREGDIGDPKSCRTSANASPQYASEAAGNSTAGFQILPKHNHRALTHSPCNRPERRSRDNDTVARISSISVPYVFELAFG